MNAIIGTSFSGLGNLTRATSLLLTCLAFAACAAAASAETASPETPAVSAGAPRLRLRIAVDQFKWDEIRGNPRYDYFYNSMNTDIRQGIQAALIEKLSASGHFQVMEREGTALKQSAMEDSIDEKKRAGQAGAAVVEQRQKRTPAQFIITPTVTGLQVTGDEGNGASAFGVRVGKKKTTVTLTLNIRIFDAQTSALVATATAEGRQETNEKKVGVDVSSLPVPAIGGLGRLIAGHSSGASLNSSSKDATSFSAVVESTLNDAVRKIVARLSGEPWSALIAATDPTTGRVIVNVGSDAGITMGHLFDVMKAGGVVLDPDSGDVLTRGDESKIGRIRVARVERNVAYCDVVEGKIFEPKNVIRLAQR